jgi:predicted transposase YdaD
MSGQGGPHDAVFRRVLGEPINAASQLRAVLPAVLVERLDLDRLTRVSGSFVDADLRWRHSDLLFTVPLAGRPALVYVLVEHQSSTDALMPFRMLRYIVRIWDSYVAEHPEATRLPAVIPLVVHHNRRPWAGHTQLLELLDLDAVTTDAARDYLPRFQFILDDLALLDEQALRARPLTLLVRVTLLLLKIAPGNRRLATDLRPWSPDLRGILDQPGGAEVFPVLVRYIGLVGEAPADELFELFAALGPEAKEAYMTTAEMLRAEGRVEGEARGRVEGEARGRVEGEARGRVEGQARALVQLLTLKFGSLPQTARDSIQAATTGQLETWTARVLTADALEQVLR